MNLNELNKIIKDEEILHSYLGIALPMIFSGILMMILGYETGDNLSEYVLIIPILYFIIFLVVYERKFFFKRLKTKSSKYFFEILKFERSVIRFEYIEKFHKYSIIFLILFTITSAIGIYVTASDQISEYGEYDTKSNIYENKIKETYRFSESELRDYFHNQIAQMNTIQVDMRIVSVMGNEVYGSPNNATFAEYHMPGNNLLGDMDSDIDRRNFLHSKYNEMEYDELQKILSRQLEKLKPNPFDYNSLDNTFIEFLIIVWFFPAIMVYMIFPLKYSLTKHLDFYYLISKACFIIVSTVKDLDEMKKRKYLLMGLNYYEKYVDRNTSMNINRFNEIKSVFVNYNSNQLSMISHNFLESLEMENKLELLNFIQNKIRVLNTSQYLIHITFAIKIKENWKIMATIISTLLSLMLYMITFLVTQQTN